MAAAMVHEGRPVARGRVELGPGRRAPLGQVELAVTAAEQPLARAQAVRHHSQSGLQLGDGAAPGEVGAEGGEAVVDDVSVGVVEARQHRGSAQLQDPRLRTLQAEQYLSTHRQYQAAADGEVRKGPQTGPAKGPDAASGEQQVGLHVTATVVWLWRSSTFAPTPSPCPARRCAGPWPTPSWATMSSARTRPSTASRRSPPSGSARRPPSSWPAEPWATSSACWSVRGRERRSSPTPTPTSSSPRRAAPPPSAASRSCPCARRPAC